MARNIPVSIVVNVDSQRPIQWLQTFGGQAGIEQAKSLLRISEPKFCLEVGEWDVEEEFNGASQKGPKSQCGCLYAL